MSKWTEVSSNSSGPEYKTNLLRNDESGLSQQRLIVGTATTGLVRIEWIQARYGQIFPTNWSWVQMWQFMADDSFLVQGYQVDDAQNVICGEAVKGDYEWLLLYEHDMIPKPDAMVRLGEYMKRSHVPVLSGLYFTRSTPSEPLIYRGRGTLAFEDFDIGDEVWCDGVPTGFLLIHMSIIRSMWEESPEYMAGPYLTRRIFETPAKAWFDPELGLYQTRSGTSDLKWCERVIEEGFFDKAGWPDYQNKRYPFLVDTNIALEHIDNSDGVQYPIGGTTNYWKVIRELRKEDKKGPEGPTLGINVTEEVKVSDKVN